jgi:hypothetical protein
MTSTVNPASLPDVAPARFDHAPASWTAAVLAGLPHLLMGLLIGGGKLLVTTVHPPPTLSTSSGILFMAVVVAGHLFAWRRHWPLWSASWYGYGVWAAMALASLGLNRVDLEGAWAITHGLYLCWIGLVILGYVALLVRDQLRGLLAVAFLMPMLGLTLLEFVPNVIEGWLAIGLGLLAAGAAGAIVRLGSFSTGLGLALGVNLVAGVALAYVTEYQGSEFPLGMAAAPTLSGFATGLIVYLVPTLGLIGLPLLLLGLWQVVVGQAEADEVKGQS